MSDKQSTQYVGKPAYDAIDRLIREHEAECVNMLKHISVLGAAVKTTNTECDRLREINHALAMAVKECGLDIE